MIKTIKLLLLVLFLSVFNITNINAYTKEDIINLTENINTCSSETKALLNGVRASYSRLLNERNISDSNINKIYSNVKKAMDILNNNNLCSVDQKNNITKSLKNNLYKLFNETNNIILSSPKITADKNQTNNSETSNNKENNSNSKPTDSKVVVDTSTGQIKIYEDGTLTNAIELKEKLNYVGLNNTLIVVILLMIIALLALIIFNKYIKNNMIKTSLFYILILILPLTIFFRNELSIILDTISLMKVKINENEKQVLVSNEKIISYPSYGSKYATIYLNDNKGDVYFGDSSNILKKGVGQANSSYLPGEGKKTILSGHNTGIFKELLKIKKNETFIIETIYGEFKYKVEEIKIIDDEDVDILDSNYDLIMYTCYPDTTLYGNKRFVVLANIIESNWIGDWSEE